MGLEWRTFTTKFGFLRFEVITQVIHAGYELKTNLTKMEYYLASPISDSEIQKSNCSRRVASGTVAFKNSFVRQPVARISSTGILELCTTRSAMLPSSQRAGPVRP